MSEIGKRRSKSGTWLGYLPSPKMAAEIYDLADRFASRVVTCKRKLNLEILPPGRRLLAQPELYKKRLTGAHIAIIVSATFSLILVVCTCIEDQEKRGY